MIGVSGIGSRVLPLSYCSGVGCTMASLGFCRWFRDGKALVITQEPGHGQTNTAATRNSEGGMEPDGTR